MRITPLWDSIKWDGFERVIFLSPHMDDAIFSCGALLMSLRAKVPRLVITITCSQPIPNGPTQSAKNRKGFVSPKIRRKEDMKVLKSIHCNFVHLGFQDAIYRRSPSSGCLIYRKAISHRRQPHVEDSGHIESLVQVLKYLCHNMGKVLLISPLGIGNHIDHIITAQVALRLENKQTRLLFYEDFPYVRTTELVPGIIYNPAFAIRDLGFEPKEYFYHPVDVGAKVELMMKYESQIIPIFGSKAIMREKLSNHTFKDNPCEFYWRLKGTTFR